MFLCITKQIEKSKTKKRNISIYIYLCFSGEEWKFSIYEYVYKKNLISFNTI